METIREENLKKCSKCDKYKDISCFHKSKVSKSGVASYCKDCRSKMRKVVYVQRKCEVCGSLFVPKMRDSKTCGSKCSCKLSNSLHKDRVIRNNKDSWFRIKSDPIRYEKRNKVRKEYDKLYREHKKGYYKQYNIDNKDRLKALRKEYYEINKGWLSEKYKEYRKRNRDLINAQRRKSFKNRMELRVLHNLRNRVYKILRGRNKSKTTLELLGCSLDHFKKHLELQFTEGMSWENYGEWHVDHIIPCSSFNLLDPKEMFKCFHYTNLQPLWAMDNILKSNKVVNYFS